MNKKIFSWFILIISNLVVIYGQNNYLHNFTNLSNNYPENNSWRYHNSNNMSSCYSNGYRGPCDPTLPANKSSLPPDHQPPKKPNNNSYEEFINNYENYENFRELQETKEHVKELINKCFNSENIKDLVCILELDDFLDNYEALTKIFKEDILFLDEKLLSFGEVNSIKKIYNYWFNNKFSQANKKRLEKIMLAYKEALKNVQEIKDSMQFIVLNCNLNNKNQVYSTSQSVLKNPTTKNRINNPELISQFGKKLFDFRFIDISKQLRDYYNGTNTDIILNSLNHYLINNDELIQTFNYNQKHYNNIICQAQDIVNRIKDSQLSSNFNQLLSELKIENRIDKIINSELRHNVKHFIQNALEQREQFINTYNIETKDFRVELGDKVIQASCAIAQNYAIKNNQNLTQQLTKNSLNALKFIYGFSNEFSEKFTNDLFMRIAGMPLSLATGALIAYFGFPVLIGVATISISFRIAQIINGIPLSGEHFENYRQALGDEDFILAGREYFKALRTCGVVDLTEDVISIFTGGDLITKGINKVAKITKLDSAAQTIIKNVKKLTRFDRNIDFKVGKKYRKRTRKLKQLEECFDPVINADGTISYQPSDSKDKLIHRMESHNQCHNSSTGLKNAQKDRYKKLGIHHHRHDKIKKIIKDICKEDVPKDLDETVLQIQKVLTDNGLKIDAAHILLPEIDKNGYILGLHSDYFFKYFKDVKITNYKELPGGAWSAYISINGSVPTFKTFFPKNMTPEKISKVVIENFNTLDLNNLKVNSRNQIIEWAKTEDDLILKYIIEIDKSLYKIKSVMPDGKIGI